MVGGGDLAYVIYTSGSTGRPKGVMVEHGGIRSYILGMQHEFPLTERDCFLQLTPLSFDVSAYEIFWPLATGGRVVLADHDGQHDLDRVAELVDRAGVTALHMVPSLMRQFVQAYTRSARSRLRYAFVSGEAVDAALAGDVVERLGSEVVNLYGATEVSVDSTFWRSAVRPDGTRVPVGRPMANATVYVLDDEGRPVPPGTIGEIYLGGTSVARGYLGSPGLTAERFVPDPFGGVPGARCFRTGDFGLWQPDGELEFVGRIDHQVKLNGWRVDLGEVESVLCGHPEVAAAVVTVHRRGDGARLVGYVVPAGGTGGANLADVHAFLRAHLPRALVPAQLVPLAALPVNSNGKVDRGALPEPVAAGTVGSRWPRDGLERQIAELWEQVLDLSPVPADQTFFALGGDSIRATRLVARLREAVDDRVSVRLVFENQSVAEMAAAVARLRGDLPDAAPAVPGNAVSELQRSLWLLEEMTPGVPVYAMPVVLRLRGPVDVAALGAALAQLVVRHPGLRSRFPERDGRPVHDTLPPEEFGLAVGPLDGEASGGVPDGLLRFVRDRALELDVRRGPLFRPFLLGAPAADHYLVLMIHHILADGWSVEVLLHDLAGLYRAAIDGRAATPVLDGRHGYERYLAWQAARDRDGGHERDLAFWRDRLGDLPPLTTFPTGGVRPGQRSGRGGTTRVRIGGAPDVERLDELARRCATTRFGVLLAGLFVLLHRLTGQDDLVLGTVISGRPRTELESVVGLCANSVALRCRIVPELSVAALVAQVRDALLDAQEHGGVPFARVVGAVLPERPVAATPVFQVLAVAQAGSYADALALPGVCVEDVAVDCGAARADVAVQFRTDPAGDLYVQVEYDSDLFAEVVVAGWVQRLGVVLGGLVAGSGGLVSEVGVMSGVELDRVVRG
ncbi:MAG TPA: amino acid adenylation domain-containing protein, partial [Rugosimonospora sp.]|nr:amino acid adenylation domain-containing protein [Rugosimonospora sp.]